MQFLTCGNSFEVSDCILDVLTIRSPAAPCTENQVLLSAWEGQGDVVGVSAPVDCDEAGAKATLFGQVKWPDEVMSSLSWYFDDDRLEGNLST